MPTGRAPRVAGSPYDGEYHPGMPARTTQPRTPAAATEAVPSAHDEPAGRVLRRFRIVFNAVKSHFQQVERRSGLGGAQLWALSVIRLHPSIGVGGLARAMDIHQSTASNLVKSLVERELIAVSRDGPDKRAVRLVALPAGVRLLRHAPGPFAGVLPQALGRLDAPTLARMEKDLDALIRLLGADRRAGGKPLAQI